ncbi:MAG TPA: CapA family protein [Anaerolineae bacterium]|nr:CapA family protein [Anaerolineae bacterium]HPL27239.1 CapA family protein [Anaerolineae bacterium]
MRLLCVGDVALAGEWVASQVWSPLPGIASAEETRVLLNWELPIGDVVNPAPRSSGPRLLAHAASPLVVSGWCPGLATLATNHILDAKEEGLARTMEALQQEGFVTVGAGRTREEIARPALWETATGRLAIANWVFPETHPDWMAVPGPNCWPGRDEASRIIRRLRDVADWVLVVVHWSDELFPYPRPEDRAIARELAEMGADLIVGHHPHVVRGMEVIGRCPVFYSLGDLYFSEIRDDRGNWIVRRAPRNREGLGIEITFARGKNPTYQALSFWQQGSQVAPDPRGRAARRMAWASRPLQRFQGSRYAEWYGAQRSRFDRWGGRWHFGVRKLGWRGLVQRASCLSRSRWAGRGQRGTAEP